MQLGGVGPGIMFWASQPLRLQMSSVNPSPSSSTAVLTGVAEKRHQRLARPAVPPEGQLPRYIK